MDLCQRILICLSAGAALAAGAAAAERQAPPPLMAQAPPGAAPVLADGPEIPEPGEIFRDCDACPEMVVVPAGEFRMGSSATAYERPEHRVTIASPFAVGRREITFDDWDLCAPAACKYRPNDRGWGRGSHPVIDVSWNDAHAFIAWLSQKTGKKYRLLSESEWEYVARAGTSSPFWWGRAAASGAANCQDCSSAPLRQTLPAGSLRPNPFGLFDVAGNAAEWVEDCWNDTYRGAPADGAAWIAGQCTQRGIRGGSFASGTNIVRSSARFKYDQDVRYYTNGFRIARDLR